MDLETFESIRQKMNLSTMSKPALIGVATVLVVVAVLVAGRLLGAATTTEFELSKGSGRQAIDTPLQAAQLPGQPAGGRQGSWSTQSADGQAGQGAGDGQAQVDGGQASEGSDEGQQGAQGDAGAGQHDVGSASGAGQQGDAGGSGGSCIYVHVTGAVNAPGLCELRPGARVDDAVQAAGGFTEDAATWSVNLARPVSDGEQIIVATTEAAGQPGFAGGQAGETPAAQDAGGEVSTPASPGLVNVNTADAAQLKTLPGIGDATAARIVSDRQANGPFKAIEDLKRVSGIGDKKFEALRDLICV